MVDSGGSLEDSALGLPVESWASTDPVQMSCHSVVISANELSRSLHGQISKGTCAGRWRAAAAEGYFCRFVFGSR
jgi:hypothetical protein